MRYLYYISCIFIVNTKSLIVFVSSIRRWFRLSSTFVCTPYSAKYDSPILNKFGMLGFHHGVEIHKLLIIAKVNDVRF